MTQKRIFVLSHNVARVNAINAVSNAPEGYRVEIREPGRSLDQNAAMWPILEAFSEQLEWPVNGAMSKLTADEWKDLLTAAFKQEQPRVAMGMNGGMVMLGYRTSKFGKKAFSEFLEFLHAMAVDRGVEVYAMEA